VPLAAAVIKACALLTAAEVANVFGEKPLKIRPSMPRHDESHCLFTLHTAAKSVSLEATRGPRAVEFAERLRVAAETEGDEAGEHEEPAIGRVLDLGDEAFWAAGPTGGLYVRRGETMLRFNINGEQTKEAKLGKLRLLAGKALSRLPR
jgi:hypothetical protein